VSAAPGPVRRDRRGDSQFERVDTSASRTSSPRHVDNAEAVDSVALTAFQISYLTSDPYGR